MRRKLSSVEFRSLSMRILNRTNSSSVRRVIISDRRTVSRVPRDPPTIFNVFADDLAHEGVDSSVLGNYPSIRTHNAENIISSGNYL